MAKPYLSSHPPPQVRKRLGVSGVRLAPFVPNEYSLAVLGLVGLMVDVSSGARSPLSWVGLMADVSSRSTQAS